MKVLILILGTFLLSIVSHGQHATASGQVSTFTIDAPQLQSEKRIWLYLPKNYDTNRKKYPVIYMHDGQNLFDDKTSYVGEWHIDEKLDSINAQIIIVGIEHGGEQRTNELTPFKNEKYGGGGADKYLDFIVNTLKPQVDKTYRTKSDSKHTAIFGSSLGGLVSFYATLKYPKVFGKAGVFSPSFWFTADIYNFARKVPKIKSKLYFLSGDSEGENMVSDMDKMYELVGSKRCDCLNLSKKIIVEGGKHNEKLWSNHFINAYLWLF